MDYVFDTSALVGAWVRHYPPDLFPQMWSELDLLCRDGRMLVPEEVFHELSAKDDDLHAWVQARAEAVVVSTSRAEMLEARAVLTDFPFLTKTGTGRGKADPFVIASASIRGMAVVTQEQGGTADKPRIPYVCQQRNVACFGLLELIRAEGWRF